MRITRMTSLCSAAGLAVAGAAWAAAATAGVTSGDAAPVPSEKAENIAYDAARDEENRAIGADPTRLGAVTKAKADAHQAHLQDLASASEAPAAWPTGIFEDTEAPSSGMDFLGSNRWVGQIGPVFVAVFAGRSGQSSEDGRVLITRSDSEQRRTLDLPGAGPLRVVQAVGQLVTLVDPSGKSHVLDAMLGRWVA